MSQHDAYLRLILDLDMPQEGTDFNSPETNSITPNILGQRESDSHLVVAREIVKVPGARVHLCVKGLGRPGCKWALSLLLMYETGSRMQPLIACVGQIGAERKNNIPEPVAANLARTTNSSEQQPLAQLAVMGPDSGLPVLKPILGLLDDMEILIR